MFLSYVTKITPFAQLIRIESFPIVFDLILDRARKKPRGIMTLGYWTKQDKIATMAIKEFEFKGAGQ